MGILKKKNGLSVEDIVALPNRDERLMEFMNMLNNSYNIENKVNYFQINAIHCGRNKHM